MILLMFSGGLDSTGVFFKLINEQENIHVHHIHLINKENRNKAEETAVKNICEYMKKIKSFTYTESAHETPCINGKFMWDSDMYNFMAGYICSCEKINKIALGLTKNDLIANRNGINKRIERGKNIINSFDCKVEKIYPVADMTKKEIYEMLPSDLRDLTWSCRTPIYKNNFAIKCGKCKTCKELIFPKQQ